MLLKFAIQDYIEDREFKNLSPATIKTYKTTLNEFQDYCSKNKIVNVEDVKLNHIKNYLRHCQSVRKNNAVTTNHKIRNLRTFFNYMVEIEIIEEKNNPMKKISVIKEDVKIEVFTEQQVKQILKYLRRKTSRHKGFFNVRDYTVVMTLVSTGMRIGELCNLKWNDINFLNSSITVFGKNREQRTIPIVDKLRKELADYKVFCEKFFGELPEYIFTNSRGKKATVNSIKCLFKKLKSVMNFKDVRLSAHTFRHYFTQKMIENGADPFTVQKMLGHKTLDMTQKYMAMWGTALQEQNEKFNPLNNMDI